MNPEVEWSFRHEADSLPDNEQLVERRDEWKFADKIVCASSFTKRTLIEVGCEEENITVVPYGIESRLSFKIGDVTTEICRFLFVGQGVQRKGLHHLLKAWRLCRPDRSELIILTRRMDPGIAPLLEQLQVRYFPWVSDDALQKLFEVSDVFVMPSLVEGFGLVFGEALSAGLCCIGITNTGLADLELAEDEAKILEVNEIGNYTVILSNTLNEVAEKILTSKRKRTSLTRSMKTFTWASHRKGIQKFLYGQN